MDRNAYYLLLSSLASAAIAGCGQDDDPACPHKVVTKEETRFLAPVVACGNVGREARSPDRYGVVGNCRDLCTDPTITYCTLEPDYLAAYEGVNGRLPRPPQDAGVPVGCPDWEGGVPLICIREEQRGQQHSGCAVEGRRPQGMRAPERSADAEVGDYLARSAYLEAASVLAFERLAQDLARLGAPAELVADCLEAAREEVGHAQVVGALARARGAEVAEVQVGEQRTPSRLELAIENVSEGVVRETYGALQALVRARMASAEDVRDAMARIAREETSHAALSARIAVWLETQLSVEERARVVEARRIAIEELRRELADEPSAALRDELGLPSRALALNLVEQLEARVWQQAA
jgi:hypothetical protein